MMHNEEEEKIYKDINRATSQIFISHIVMQNKNLEYQNVHCSVYVAITSSLPFSPLAQQR